VPRQQELARRKEAHVASSGASSRATVGAEWPEAHAREFGASGLRWGSGVPGACSQSPWCEFLLPREVDALTYSTTREPGELLRDVSQSLTRVPTSYQERTASGGFRHVAMTCMPRAVPWLDLGKMSRIMLGRESLLLQGFPTSRVPVDAFPESFMQDLAGNAMAVPVVLAVLMASFCAIHWREATAEDAPAATQADVDAALAAFEQSMQGRAASSTILGP
jgi:hypothetical protein